MKRLFIIVIIGAGLMIAAMQSVAEVDMVESRQADPPATQGDGQCNPGRLAFRIENALETFLQDESFVPVPDTEVAFTQAGGGPSCVIVVLSSEMTPGSTDFVRVRAVIPEVGVSQAIEAIGAGAPASGFWTVSYQFVFPEVPPGEHEVHLEIASVGGNGSGTPGMRRRTIVVHHAGPGNGVFHDRFEE